jgi:hypothetical protein
LHKIITFEFYFGIFMTDKEENKKSEDKTAEVAPYLSAKKEEENDTSSKTGTLVPAIIILVVAVVIVASFFEDEYKSLMASLNPETNTAVVFDETIAVENTGGTIEAVDATPVSKITTEAPEVETKATVEVATISPAIGEKTNISTADTPTQTTSQPGLITVYNPYLRPYPQVYAPIPPQAPYGMSERQAKAYTDMMQKRQKAVAEMVEMRNAAMQRREQNRLGRMQRMEQQRAQAQKAHAEMLKRRQEANQI